MSDKCASTLIIEYGFAGCPINGEKKSGDRQFINLFPNKALLAVVDGLGHGYEAAIASEIAINTLKKHLNCSVIDMLKYCHEALLKTRGVVMTIALLNKVDNTITWVGVGNIEGVLLQDSIIQKHSNSNEKIYYKFLISKPGVVGYELPTLQISNTPIFLNDILILATDGIQGGFYKKLPLNESPQKMADYILTNFKKKTDDALVLIIRYLG